jgi:hypothetical protein
MVIKAQDLKTNDEIVISENAVFTVVGEPRIVTDKVMVNMKWSRRMGTQVKTVEMTKWFELGQTLVVA